MTPLERQSFTPESLRQIVPSRTRLPVSLKPYLNVASESPLFTGMQILAILNKALGEHVLLTFLAENCSQTYRTAGHVLDDHLRYADLRRKDLQVNLIVNLIVALTRAKNLHAALQFKYAEDLLRKLDLVSTVKVEMKEAMFDRQALTTPWLHITYVK